MNRSLIVFAGLLFVTGSVDAAELFGRNTEVPFAYLSGGWMFNWIAAAD